MKSAQRFLLALIVCTATSFANEIRNGDFIDGLKGWVLQREGFPTILAKDAIGFCQFEDDGVILDAAAIENQKEKPASLTLLQYLKDMREGTDYTLSFEMKVPAGEVITYGLGIPIDVGQDRGNLIGGVILVETKGTGEWTPVTVNFRWDPTQAISLGATEQPSLQFRIGLATNFGIRHVRLEALE